MACSCGEWFGFRAPGSPRTVGSAELRFGWGFASGENIGRDNDSVNGQGAKKFGRRGKARLDGTAAVA